MTADERIALSRVKVERAQKHILDLQREIQAFLDSEPYTVDTKPDSQIPNLSLLYLKRVEPTPNAIALIAGDALFNLRAALDYLVWHLVDIGCTRQNIVLSKAERKQIGFPIIDTDSPTEYEASRKRKVKGMTQPAIDAIDTKPYKGGNDTLWRLNQLNNIDKHRLLVTALGNSWIGGFRNHFAHASATWNRRRTAQG